MWRRRFRLLFGLKTIFSSRQVARSWSVLQLTDSGINLTKLPLLLLYISSDGLAGQKKNASIAGTTHPNAVSSLHRAGWKGVSVIWWQANCRRKDDRERAA